MKRGPLHELGEHEELGIVSQPTGRSESLIDAIGADEHQNTCNIPHAIDSRVHTLPSLSTNPYDHDPVGRAKNTSIPSLAYGDSVPVTSSISGKYLHPPTGFDTNHATDLPILPTHLPNAPYLHAAAFPNLTSVVTNVGASQLSERARLIAAGGIQNNSDLNQNARGISVQSIPHIPISGVLPANTHLFARDGSISSLSSDDSGIGSSSLLHSMDQSSCPVTSLSSTIQSSRSQSVSLAAPGPIPPSAPSLMSQSFSGTSKGNSLIKDLQPSISLSARARSDGKNLALLSDSYGYGLSQEGSSALVTSTVASEPRSRRKVAARRVECSIRKTTTERVTIRELPADGYCWRKYGSKRLPNNAYPKSYFRCSVPGCQAKRYVTETDNRVLKTEYIGEHNHGKSSSTAHEATSLADVCRLAALGQNFLIKTDVSFNVLSKTFLDLAVLLRPSIFGNEYLILNGFGSVALDDSDRRYRDPINGLEITEISENIYPLSVLTSITMTFFAKGVELSNALNLALAQLNQNFRERAMYVARKQDNRGRSYAGDPSTVVIPSEDPSIKGASSHAPRGRKLIISCKLPSYDQVESCIDFFRWKKYGHKPQTDTRLDSKSYYRCAFFNCPARRTITFFYSINPDGTETIESMIVQYDNQHTHPPDKTRIPYKDCIKLLKPPDHLSIQPVRSADPSIFTAPTSYLGVTGVTVAQRPVFTSLAAHMATPIGEPAGHHPAAMHHGVPMQAQHGITDTNTISHGTQVAPSMYRSDSFERASCLLFPKVDSMVLQEGFPGLHTEQNLYGCVSTPPGYGAPCPYAAQPDYSNYGLLQSNSFLFLNQLGQNQPQLDQAGDLGHSPISSNLGSTSKIPAITTNQLVHSSNMESELLSYSSTVVRGDENISLTSAENDFLARTNDSLMGPVVNVYS